MQTRFPPLFKVSATGNDFVVLDLTSPGALEKWQASPFAQTSRAEWTRRWCHRHNGIGADGAVFLLPDSELDFAWDFYNDDGGPAEMCGNAARAVCLLQAQKRKATELCFRTAIGPVTAKVQIANSIIDIELPPIQESHWNQWTSEAPTSLAFDFVRAGVPHAVVGVPDVQDQEGLRALAQQIKREPRFKAQGTNVTFVRRLPGREDRIESVTYERGVEGFTLSCGTGAVAAAHCLLRGEENRPLTVAVPGGELTVIWKASRPHLIGPATIIAEIHWLQV